MADALRDLLLDLERPTLAEEFAEALKTEVDESLTCPCGARGMEPCRIGVHAASLASFAAMNSRSLRLRAIQIAQEDTQP